MADKTFAELMKDEPDLGNEYTEYLRSKGDDIPEQPDWEGFRKAHPDLPEESPSDLLDVHAKLRSGLLGNVVGKVTDTLGGVTGGVLGGDKK